MALRITFLKTGTNQFGAITGQLTLLDDSSQLLQATAFSGGNSFNPLDDGLYRLHLDIRGDESSNLANTDGTLQPFYGIQKVGTQVVDANGQSWDMQYEWGSIRARLNPATGGQDHGDYLHGKHRAGDWTHGCICDRTEGILNYLWNLSSPPTAIDVDVSGGLHFNLDRLLPRNIARKSSSRALVEVEGRIRGLDGFDFPDNQGCQTFLRLRDGSELVLFTDSSRLQALLETAFSTQSETTIVYQPNEPRNRVLQVRFNRLEP